MHYVVRDPNGSVISLHREPVDGAELLPSNHPDVQAFLGQQGGRSFAEMDANLVRVLEDLIDALLRRNVLRITDLPLEAQVKLFERKQFRENMQGSARHAAALSGRSAARQRTPALPPHSAARVRRRFVTAWPLSCSPSTCPPQSPTCPRRWSPPRACVRWGRACSSPKPW